MYHPLRHRQGIAGYHDYPDPRQGGVTVSCITPTASHITRVLRVPDGSVIVSITSRIRTPTSFVAPPARTYRTQYPVGRHLYVKRDSAKNPGASLRDIKGN